MAKGVRFQAGDAECAQRFAFYDQWRSQQATIDDAPWAGHVARVGQYIGHVCNLERGKDVPGDALPYRKGLFHLVPQGAAGVAV